MRTVRKKNRPHTLKVSFVGRVTSTRHYLVIEIPEPGFAWRSTGRKRTRSPAVDGETFEVVLRRVIRPEEPAE